MLHNNSKIVKLLLIVSSVSLLSTGSANTAVVYADSESDMDHEIDFDFDDGSDDMIPVTPQEQGEDGAPEDSTGSSDNDTDLIVPHEDQDSSHDQGWMAYLDYLGFGKEYAKRWLKHV